MRDGQQVLRPPQIGDLDQVAFRQPGGFRQNRGCDGYFLMIGKLTDGFPRSGFRTRKRGAELRQRPRFHLLHETDKDVVEDADLVFVQPVGIGQEQIGDLAKHLEPPLRRAALHRTFQFRD